MHKNKDHWYDGVIYDRLIAPGQDKSFQIVKSIVTANSSVIDVGCGTGRLAFQLRDRCRTVVGVDLSARNIDIARRTLLEYPSPGIYFHHADVRDFLRDKNKRYDYAVLSYVLHEMDELERPEVLRTLSDSADKIIIVDYLCPRQKVFWSALNEAIEFSAGKDHYRNFRSYMKKGGIAGLVEAGGLRIIDEIRNRPATSHLIVAKKYPEK